MGNFNTLKSAVIKMVSEVKARIEKRRWENRTLKDKVEVLEPKKGKVIKVRIKDVESDAAMCKAQLSMVAYMLQAKITIEEDIIIIECDDIDDAKLIRKNLK